MYGSGNKQFSGWQAIGELRNKQPQQTCSNVFLNFHTVLETWLAWSLQCYLPLNWQRIRCSKTPKHVLQPKVEHQRLAKTDLVRGGECAAQWSLVRTWKCELETHRAKRWNSGFIIFRNSLGSIKSKISSISCRNMTSFGLFTFGQYRNSPDTT